MSRMDQAIERLRALSESEQDSMADAVLVMLESQDAPYRLTSLQVDEVRRASVDLDEGRLEILSDEDVERMWARLGA